MGTPTLDSLRAATNLHQLAYLFALKPAVLAMQIYKKDKRTGWYSTFDIPKKGGGVRTIHAPEPHLKMLQRRLSDLLLKCEEEIVTSHGHADSSGIAHGFKPGRSIVTNGREHVGRRYVFNVDLQNFFGAIHFGRVRAFFSKNKNFLLDPKAAEILAHIACFQGALPQGSPCSPVISNLMAHAMDIRLAEISQRFGVSYTRYADDLTFSSNLRAFPPAIAQQVTKHEWLPGKALVKTVERNGFSLNPKKTRMQYCDSRQEVTGLTVNRKVNVTASYRYTTRAMVDRLFRTGEFVHIYHSVAKNGSKVATEIKGSMRQLLGRLMHIDYVDLFNQRLRENNGLEPISTRGRLELFRRFLYYFHFHAPSQPVIVCEGKTDNVYLRCAIKSRGASFPLLADTTATPSKLKVRFFKYSDRRTSVITDISGGVGGICKLMKHLHSDQSAWKGSPRPLHPVIVVIDSDSGASNIYEAIAGITKKPKPKGFAPFIHVVSNLYVVPTPLSGKASTDIEDLFDLATKNEKLGGKSFNKAKEIDSDTEYGKAAFALNVVAKKCDSIYFGGFDPLLDRISKAMQDYYDSIAAKPA